MQVQLSFTEEFRYPDDSSGITIPVRLTHGEKILAVYYGQQEFHLHKAQVIKDISVLALHP